MDHDLTRFVLVLGAIAATLWLLDWWVERRRKP